MEHVAAGGGTETQAATLVAVGPTTTANVPGTEHTVASTKPDTTTGPGRPRSNSLPARKSLENDRTTQQKDTDATATTAKAGTTQQKDTTTAAAQPKDATTTNATGATTDAAAADATTKTGATTDAEKPQTPPRVNTQRMLSDIAALSQAARGERPCKIPSQLADALKQIPGVEIRRGGVFSRNQVFTYNGAKFELHNINGELKVVASAKGMSPGEIRAVSQQLVKLLATTTAGGDVSVAGHMETGNNDNGLTVNGDNVHLLDENGKPIVVTFPAAEATTKLVQDGSKLALDPTRLKDANSAESAFANAIGLINNKPAKTLTKSMNATRKADAESFVPDRACSLSHKAIMDLLKTLDCKDSRRTRHAFAHAKPTDEGRSAAERLQPCGIRDEMDLRAQILVRAQAQVASLFEKGNENSLDLLMQAIRLAQTKTPGNVRELYQALGGEIGETVDDAVFNDALAICIDIGNGKLSPRLASLAADKPLAMTNDTREASLANAIFYDKGRLVSGDEQQRLRGEISNNNVIVVNRNLSYKGDPEGIIRREMAGEYGFEADSPFEDDEGEEFEMDAEGVDLSDELDTGGLGGLDDELMDINGE